MKPSASTTSDARFSLRRVQAVTRKEIWHIWRDPFTLGMALVLPMILVVIFGIAIDFDVHNAPLAVQDQSQSAASREFIRIFANSGTFRIEPTHTDGPLEGQLRDEQAKAVLAIPPQFARDLEIAPQINAQFLLDGADNTTAGSILTTLTGVQEEANRRLVPGWTPPPATLAIRLLFNPELKTPWFIVPGLAVVVAAIVSILLTALTVAREWENGSMELLLSTPVRPIELIIGKLAPYTIIGLLAVLFIYIVARLGFGVPFRGSHLVLLAGAFLFLSAYLAQGLLISVVTRKQQLSMQFAIVSGLLPSVLLSGFVFPIESMPTPFHYLTMIFPARWFMVISRDLFLKGTYLPDLIAPFGALLLLNTIMLSVAVRRFKRDVEP
jgi:ABC-2 type transport system permease protein